jgi:orotate phosphoribosyltransferase
MSTEQKVAQELIKIGAVKFVPDNPIIFKSGIKAPMYVDNREFPFHPDSWKVVIEGFENLTKKKNIKFDVIAGVAVAGIPHSAAVAFALGKPSIFVRKEAKDHGTKSLVEGGNVKDKKVLLIEDLVSTGGSSLRAVREIRNAGGVVEDCLVIVSYEFPEVQENFKNGNVKLHALTSVPVILEEALKIGSIKENEAEKIKKWMADPHGLGK